MTTEEIRQAVIDLWLKEYKDMRKELNGIDIYFITGFVIKAIESKSKPKNKQK